MRMTYTIQPGPFFSGSTKLGKRCQTLSSSELFKKDRRLTVRSSIAVESRHHEESYLIHGPLAFILIDQGFLVEYELDEFNTPHTGTTLSRFLSDIQPLHPWATFSGHMLPSPNNQDHTSMDDYTIPVLNQQTRLLLHLWRPYLTHTFNNTLTITLHISLRHLAAKMPSHLHNYFLPSFLRDLQYKRNPLFHAAIKNHYKNLSISRLSPSLSLLYFPTTFSGEITT